MHVDQRTASLKTIASHNQHGFSLPPGGSPAVAGPMPVTLASAERGSFYPGTALGRIDPAGWPGLDWQNKQVAQPPPGSAAVRVEPLPENNPLERALNDRVAVATARVAERMTGMAVLPVRANDTQSREVRSPAGMPETLQEREYRFFVKGDPQEFARRFEAAGGNAAARRQVAEEVYRTDIPRSVLDGAMNTIVVPLLRRITDPRQFSF